MKKKTAVLVIHGIGQQEPFETLNDFVMNFTGVYQDAVSKHPGAGSGKADVETWHMLKRFPDTWTESFIRVDAPKVPEAPRIDVYEYYWAHMTQRMISTGEVLSWIVDVAQGASSFYSRNKHLRRNEKEDHLFEDDGELKKYKYLVCLLGRGKWLWKGLVMLESFLKDHPGLKTVPFLNWLGMGLTGLKDALTGALKGPMVDFMGDVTLYTTTDNKSQYYAVRQKILDGAVLKAKALILDPDHDELLLVGHSLGSVIAYDVVSRLNKEAKVDPAFAAVSGKLKGLVTFGSPLDKIAFFFDERISPEQKVRRDMVSQLHGFRRRHVSSDMVRNGIGQHLDGVDWLNFWIRQDPVSGHLDVYDPVTNIELVYPDIQSDLSVESHGRYWKEEKMYREIIQTYKLS